jgi:hypothetical protein
MVDGQERGRGRSVVFLDDNMLKFEELSAEHIECLVTIVEDPGHSDTLLAAGRRSAE